MKEDSGRKRAVGRRSTVVLLAAIALLWGGCGWMEKLKALFDDTTTKTVNVLNDAIQSLDYASADWQSVLRDAQSKLTRDAQSTVRNEIANLVSRSIAQGGVELRCNADFVRDRVRQALVRIRARLLKQAVPPVEPGFCQVVPLAVDRELVPSRIRQVEFYGYDFDQSGTLKVFHEESGTRHDVTAMVDRPTHYAMTLKFGGTGIQLNDRSSRIVLEWEGKPVSTIAVIQPQTPVCESRVTTVQPGPLTYRPPHTGGDKDFHGHGPVVTASVTLRPSPDILRADVYMHARETRSDWTTASGSRRFDLYTPPPGWKIDRVAGPADSSQSYTDSNHTIDSFDQGSGGPVKRFAFVGDTDGDDAGVRTQVDVAFNRLMVEETMYGNCVPARAVRSLSASGLIGRNVLRRLDPGVREQLRRIGSPP